MTDLVRSKDWSKTVLGAAENWPPSLTLIVKVMLASGFPMCVRWGPEFVMIYNDGYRSILGDRHPTAFGLPFHKAWPEVQPQLRPLHEAILNGTSGAFFAEDLLIKVQRRGSREWEDARFTLSYSPIPEDTAQRVSAACSSRSWKPPIVSGPRRRCEPARSVSPASSSNRGRRHSM